MITVAAWKLGYDGFEPEQEGLREALCTLGNGYFATRGAAEEASADTVHYPGTYLAGGYNRLGTKVAGRVIENEDLVNFPNWLPLSFRPVDGDWLNLQRDEVISYRQELDLWDGVLRRRVRVRDKAGRETTVESRRLVHMGNPHLAALQMTIRPENWSGEIEVMTALDGRIINAGVARYRQLNSTHLTPLEAKPFNADGMLLVVETNQSRLRVAEAARTRFHSGGKAIAPERETRLEEGYIAQHAVVTLGEGESVTIEKVVALHTGRDSAISEPALAAVRFVSAAGGFGDLRKSHELAWHQLWERCDITLQDSHRTQMVMRLHIFHLLQTVSLHSKELDVGVPARGLHGEAYRGHIFWDEIFILPFLNFRLPDISRSLLLYRYRRLPMARVLAKEQGLAGALYPWQSGSSGREESQVMHLNPRSGRWTQDNTHLQRHANAAIAFNIWRYYEATGDRRFMAGYGAEMFVEIARLWASLTSWDEEKGRYEINGVMGPDEFHDAYPDCATPGLNNNAYSNVMAAWVLAKAEEVLQLIPAERRRELEDLLGLSEEEVARWDDISRKLFVPFHGEGIISQFEGYEDLEELDWKAYRAKYDDIQRLDRILEAEGDTVNRYKASKQADVLMLFYLFSFSELRQLFRRLGYGLNAKSMRTTIAYYLPRTSNGSTLSRLVHSWVLARSDRSQSWRLFKDALESDLGDSQHGATAEGIHLGAMAGTVDLIQRGQTALEIQKGVLHLSPCMPKELQGMQLRLLYQGSPLYAEVSAHKVIFTAPEDWAGPNKIGVRNRVHPFKAGDRLEFDSHMHTGGWRPITERVKRKGAPKKPVTQKASAGARRKSAKAPSPRKSAVKGTT
jgi:alpha,alpha-trehalase